MLNFLVLQSTLDLMDLTDLTETRENEVCGTQLQHQSMPHRGLANNRAKQFFV